MLAENQSAERINLAERQRFKSLSPLEPCGNPADPAEQIQYF